MTIRTKILKSINNTILVKNKIDIDGSYDISKNNLDLDVHNISLKDNIGLEELLEIIQNKLSKIILPDNNAVITRVRHRNQITSTLEHLERCDMESDLVCAAEDIRLATRSLSILVGKIEVDEILSEIFSSFCIGK